MKNPFRNSSFFITTYEQRGRLISGSFNKYPLDVYVRWLVEVIVQERDLGIRKTAAVCLAKVLNTSVPNDVVEGVCEILNGSGGLTNELFREAYSWRLMR